MTERVRRRQDLPPHEGWSSGCLVGKVRLLRLDTSQSDAATLLRLTPGSMFHVKHLRRGTGHRARGSREPTEWEVTCGDVLSPHMHVAKNSPESSISASGARPTFQDRSGRAHGSSRMQTRQAVGTSRVSSRSVRSASEHGRADACVSRETSRRPGYYDAVPRPARSALDDDCHDRHAPEGRPAGCFTWNASVNRKGGRDLRVRFGG